MPASTLKELPCIERLPDSLGGKQLMEASRDPSPTLFQDGSDASSTELLSLESLSLSDQEEQRGHVIRKPVKGPQIVSLALHVRHSSRFFSASPAYVPTLTFDAENN